MFGFVGGGGCFVIYWGWGVFFFVFEMSERRPKKRKRPSDPKGTSITVSSFPLLFFFSSFVLESSL